MKQSEILGNHSVNLQFKLLSAIGIIIIVSGHCYHGGISLAYDWFPAYSFNLSLFAFISGYFYKSQNESSILKYILKRAKRLLLPAYLWNIFYAFFVILMKELGYNIGADLNWYNIIIMPLFDGEAFAYNLGSWFVYPLFLVCVFNVLFRKLSGIIKLRNEYFLTAIYFMIGIFGIKLAISGCNKDIMMLITRSMFFLPCYQLGYLYKTKLERLDTLNSLAYFTVIFCIQLALLTFYNDLEFVPSGMRKFQNGLIIPYVTSITGIAFWLRVSKLIAPTIKNWNFVQLISDNTYSIMIHQMMGFMVVKWLFYLVSVTTPLFSDFNLSKLHESVWYYYLPKGLQQYGMLYLAGGIFLPIGIQKLCNIFVEAWRILWRDYITA